MSESTTPKRTRALPRVWKKFSELQDGDLFYIGKTLVQKTGFLIAREFEHDSCLGVPTPTGAGHIMWRWWLKVKTTQLVRDAKPGGKSSRDLPSNAELATIPTAEHHYEDDRCQVEVKATEPNNDNNVTGPTS